MVYFNYQSHKYKFKVGTIHYSDVHFIIYNNKYYIL